MAKTWRCAVVGTGTVGGWHVRIIPTLPNAQLVAVCDADAAKGSASVEKARGELDKAGNREAREKLAHIPGYTDLGEMLRKHPDLDVVHVCTPSGDHFTPALTALRAGKFVITEKPMEIILDRIDQMGEEARKNGVKIAGIFQNRWNDANRAIKQAADEGRFGRLAWAGSFTPWYRNDQYYRDGGWRGTWRLDGGGAVMNQSVHAIDLLQWIVGPVKTVSAYASSRIHAEIEVEDTLSCALEFAGGGYGSIVGTTAMYPGMAVRIEVGGENGTAVSENGLKIFKFREEREADKDLRDRLSPPAPEGVIARVKAHGGEALSGELFGKKAASTGGGASNTDVPLDLHGRNLHHIFSAWDAGREAETHAPEARKSVAIILAMYESARKGGAPVDVK